MPRRIKEHTTFEAIAAACGMSLSSVDRVLNERGSVSEKTREKVLAAARDLGVNRALPEAWHRMQNVGIILPRNRSLHWKFLEDAFVGFSGVLPRWMTMHRQRVVQNDPRALREAIFHPPFQRSALIIASDSSPEVSGALREVMARGETVITVTSDIEDLPAHDYSGIDHEMAGRTIGFLMRRLIGPDRQGRVVVMQVNRCRLEHAQRVAGFRQAFGQPDRVVVEFVDEESVGAAEGLMHRLAGQNVPVAGIYGTGTISSEIIPFVTKMGEARPVWITHERIPLHEELLRQGLMDFVVDQDANVQAAWALSRVVNALSGQLWAGGQIRQPELRLFCRENLS